MTQALLGAAIGQCGFAQKLGRRAVAWGAVAGTVPDLDVVIIPFTGRIGEFLWHRGPTHAFWFGPVFGVLFGYATWRWYKRRKDRSNAETPAQAHGPPDPASPQALWWWMALWFTVLFTHPLLDIFTPYGTLFFWPFSDARVALHAIPIIDPVYSVPLVAALAAGLVLRKRLQWATNLAAIALVFTTAYLFYGWHLNLQAKERVAAALAEEGIRHAEISAYPTMFQVYLRRIVVRHDDLVRVGHLTLLRPAPIQWEAPFTPDDGPLVDALLQTREGTVFQWFAMEETAAQVIPDDDGTYRVEIDDLRYGLPGKPEHGIWAVGANFDAAGNPVSGPEYFNRPRFHSATHLLAEIWRGTFALDTYHAQP